MQFLGYKSVLVSELFHPDTYFLLLLFESQTPSPLVLVLVSQLHKLFTEHVTLPAVLSQIVLQLLVPIKETSLFALELLFLSVYLVRHLMILLLYFSDQFLLVPNIYLRKPPFLVHLR